jgi:hypothetical protein
MGRKTKAVTITVPQDKVEPLRSEAEKLGLSLSKYLVMAGITFKVKNIEGRSDG